MRSSVLPPVLLRNLRRFGSLLIAAGLVLGALIAARPALAAGETVNIWLTTTNDSAGRNVIAGLQQQSPIAFASGNASAGQVITVNENTKYQQFIGAGASFTDTAAYLLNSSGALSASTRSSVMTNAVQPHQRHRPGLPAQPDGRVRPGPLQLLLRRHARRPDRPDAWRTSPSATT